MKKHVLVAGIGTYDDPEITDLSFAARDGKRVGLCLCELGGFDTVRTRSVGGNEELDHVDVGDALHNLAPLLSHEGLFLFYSAGHGIRAETEAHLLTTNSCIHVPQFASLSVTVRGERLGYMEAAFRMLTLDACRNAPLDSDFGFHAVASEGPWTELHSGECSCSLFIQGAELLVDCVAT